MNTTMQNQNTADKLAEAISIIFHPFLIVIPTMLIAMTNTGTSLTQAILWTAISIAIVIIPVLALIIIRTRAGHYSDMSISIREQRFGLYIIGSICLAVLLTVQILGGAPRVLTACLVAAVGTTVLGYIINKSTKISIHAGAVSGCAMTLLLTAPTPGLILTACIPLVAWARIRLKHHTLFQILLGCIVPGLLTFLAFKLML